MEKLRFNALREALSHVLLKASEKLNYSLKIDEIYNNFSTPPSLELAHFSFPCFRFSKVLKLAPPKIAEQWISCVEKNELIEHIEAQGPYINFKLNSSLLAKEVLPSILSGESFHQQLFQSTQKTMIEFSQPNTHKELHVGHMRNLCLGDALVKLYRYCGVETLAVTYPGDHGTHIAKCLWYLKKHNLEPIPDKHRGAWLGKMYSKASIKLEDERGSENEEQNRKELTSILQELHSQQGPYYDLWVETKQWSVDLMKEVYQWANVKFDQWYWESEVDHDSLQLVRDYQEKGLFVEDQGAVGIDLDEYKLGFCILIKSDGNGLYATKDLELARKRFQDQDLKEIIYVVDKRQSHHFKQVFKILELMNFNQAKNCTHLAYDFVELASGAISSRSGNLIPLQDLIDQMEQKIKSEHLQKYESIWSHEELNQCATQIAQGAIKYGMLSMDSNKKIVFIMDEWLKLDGESGPYIQYVFARIQSILNKTELQFFNINSFELLKEPKEAELMLMLNQFNDTVSQAFEQKKVSVLCQYLYELSKAFNSYYAQTSILKNEDTKLISQRLCLISSIAMTLKQGLALIGVSAPERM